MLNFKQYLKENTPWFTKVYKNGLGIDKYLIIDTNHAIQRTAERESSHSELNNFCKKIIEYLNTNKDLYEGSSPKFLFYSKTIGRGIVVKLKKPSKKKNDSTFCVLIVTVLPKKPEKKTFVSDSEIKIVLEKAISEDLSLYLTENFSNSELNEYGIEGYYDSGFVYDLTNMIGVEI